MQIYYPDIKAFSTSSVWHSYLLEGLKQVGNVTISDELVKQSYYSLGFTVSPIDIVTDSGKKVRVWYDWCDFKDIHLEIMKPNDLYFKIMLLNEYNDTKNVYPIGQIVTSTSQFLKDVKWLEKIISKDKDILGIFRTTNYALRVEAVKRVKAMKIKSLVGLQDYKNRKPAPKELLVPKIGYSDYLLSLKNSKLGLALPGVGGDWTWRHTEIWGLGVPMVTVTPICLLPGNPKDIFIEVKRDLSDLEEKILYYLSHNEEREQIGKNGKQYYEKYLSPKAQAQYILEKVQKL